MAIRFPLYYDRSNGSLKRITEAERATIVAAAIYEYGASPSVQLSRVSSGGTLGTLTDNRYKASATTESAGNSTPGHQTYDGSGSDDYSEPGSIINVDVDYDRITQTVESLSSPNRARPIYYDGSNNIKHMTQADFQDTFIKPAIDLLVDGNDRAGIYRIHTASSLAEHSTISSNVVFRDTSADISDFQSSNASETQDQKETVNNYYLLLKSNESNPDNKALMHAYADGNLREFAPNHFRTLLSDEIRYAATALTDYKIRYGYNGGSHSFSGQNKGSSMVDSRYNSSTVASTYYDTTGSADDRYRTQRHPSGSRVTITTYRLRVHKE